MGVCKIAVCQDCNCYVELDKISNCWDGSFWVGQNSIHTTSDVYTQILVRFLVMHHKHNVEIFYDNSDDYFDVLYIDGEVEKGKRLKEINLEDLADESETFKALQPKGL